MPALDVQISTGGPLLATMTYRLMPESGLRAMPTSDDAAMSGAQWLLLHQCLTANRGLTPLLQACLPLRDALRPQLRALLHYHCGGRNLRTRDMMLQLREL